MSEFSGPNSLPNTPLPSGSNGNLFDNLGIVTHEQEDDVWGTSVFSTQASPGSKRCPTFKDYAEKIRQLQQENFQLRVRVFLSEQKTGVKTQSSSDFTLLLQQNVHHIQNALGVNFTPHSSSSSNDLLSSQLKSENEHLNTRVIELEQKISNIELALKDKEDANRTLLDQNQALSERLQDVENECNQAKGRLLMHISTVNDSEMDRGAEIAFGGIDHEEIIEELETKLAEEQRKCRQLDDSLARLNKKIGKSDRKMLDLEKSLETMAEEKKKLNDKLVECSKVFVDLGKRNVTLSEEIEKLKTEKGANQQMDAILYSRYDDVRQLVTKMQGRMKEIVAFVEALFNLESKRIFSIVGLSEDNKRMLRRSLESCRTLSLNLDEMFKSADKSPLADRSRLIGTPESSKSNSNSFSYRSHHYDIGAFTSPPRKSVASKEIQCEFLDEARMNETRLHREIHKLEYQKQELVEERSRLLAEIDMLSSRLEASNNKVVELERLAQVISSETSQAVEMENKVLAERLSISDSALKKLHHEHAKLVAQLKQMQSQASPSPSHDKLANMYMESGRPSDSTSPDLGIDSGHDAAANSDDSNSTNVKIENNELRKINKELALKLRQSRQALQSTLDKLHSTTKHKEEVEKAICRQLHRTHTILRQAKKSVEKFANQENIAPST